jgi:hypothetical protein
MITMPEAFHSATDDLPFADDWANTPATLPVGGAMRYRPI